MVQLTPAADHRPETGPLTLVASGFGLFTPGGLFALGDGAPEPLDRIGTTGFAVHSDGTRVARLLWTNDDPRGVGELIVYDARGVRAYLRVDALREPHSARWVGDELVVVSTLDDAVLWLDDRGAVVRRFTGHGGGDCWHLNCLAEAGGHVLASAFGRFDEHRGWSAPGRRAGAGIVVDLETGDDVLTGLDAPHDPIPFEGGWLVCNSGRRELLHVDAAGAVVRRAQLGGWTRGLAIDDAAIHVGLSVRADLHATDERARVLTLDRETFAVIGEHRLPCEEVYALQWVPASLLDGLRTGFAVNPQRRRERTVLDTGREGGVNGLLGDADSVLTLELSNVPARIGPGEPFTVGFRARNDGGATLESRGRFPVVVGARWLTDAHAPTGTETRAHLGGPLEPGATDEGFLRLVAPTAPGPCLLLVGALQEGIRWFGDVDARSWAVHRIEVADGPRAPSPLRRRTPRTRPLRRGSPRARRPWSG